MKKLIFLLSFVLISSLGFSQRFSTAKNGDNTGRIVTYKYSNPAYVATLSVVPSASYTFVKSATLTGAQTVNAVVTGAKLLDQLQFIYTADGSARIVTFGTNFISAGTATAAATKQAVVTFIFDGTNFVESSRFIQP